MSLVPCTRTSWCQAAQDTWDLFTPLRYCAGAIWGLLSGRETFLIGLSALGEPSLRSSPKSKRQTARWSDALPSKSGSQRSAQPTKDCPSGECQQARRSQPCSNPCWSFPGSFPRFLPLLTSGLLGPLRKLRNFSNPERKQICIGWMTVSALHLPILWARGHWALHGRTYLRTQRIFLYIFHKRQVHWTKWDDCAI